ncbi:MAG: ABC transporter ATP-binding protein [Candidatus Scalindua sp. AMX11]|nr:MAG: ABC transporter ATP-binding protein [Candidatus Scalindua sp.]NOG82299.1 ABC-F family ATP-binding cassette domain-containing protein [Planctomycetota bacterium]RZV66663.1 MAG: ABC transporter ATP-binding protein [Candidatus Scalindua sp. SCAELEC01]TDE63640.1 MAG: ABC transporter ATP-binding protein [Candidatus Scalindua sp. AMX11]GJQ60007.1 MAG: ABC transporter ATP-binding protein [Candidatus Scalindua sp.]
MISAQNLSKQYFGHVIFDRVSFGLSPRERIGLIGRNGHGKTTLFRLLIGEEKYDEGTIKIPKDYRIGYLNQHICFTKPTILEEGCCGLQESEKEEEWKVKKILSGLGFSEDDFCRSPSEFSGGYQIRLNLAKVLVSEPNLLLLDEPTNFLDIISIRWLTNFLNSWQNEIMIISHDRSFMDTVTTHIMGIHRSKIKKIRGTTKDYYERIAQEEEIYEKERLNEEKKRRQAEQFINTFRAKARHASLVQSRIKTLEKQEVNTKLDKIPTLSFSFGSAPFRAKCVQEAHNIAFSYNGKPPYLFHNLDLTLESRDRVCIIGRNGKGKTTLLKLLAGGLSPLEGEITNHPQTKIGYYEQANTATLNDTLTIEEEVSLSNSYLERKKVRDICGAMMFSGDHALKKIKVLSGGEKCRVLFGKILVTPTNLLLLDEPTHHLDLQSCDSMIEAISSFEGAVVMVTHNEYILHKIANKLIVFQDDKAFLFYGGYAKFLDQIGWDDQESITFGKKSVKTQEKPQKAINQKGVRKARAALFTKRSKILTPYKKKIEKIERSIHELEQQLHNDTESLIKASYEKDGNRITALSQSMKEIKNNIDNLYEEMEVITERYEQEKMRFEQEEASL